MQRAFGIALIDTICKNLARVLQIDEKKKKTTIPAFSSLQNCQLNLSSLSKLNVKTFLPQIFCNQNDVFSTSLTNCGTILFHDVLTLLFSATCRIYIYIYAQGHGTTKFESFVLVGCHFHATSKRPRKAANNNVAPLLYLNYQNWPTNYTFSPKAIGITASSSAWNIMIGHSIFSMFLSDWKIMSPSVNGLTNVQWNQGKCLKIYKRTIKYWILNWTKIDNICYWRAGSNNNSSIRLFNWTIFPRKSLNLRKWVLADFVGDIIERSFQEQSLGL